MAFKKTWVDFVHPDYADLSPGWIYATDNYTGDCVKQGKLQRYLPRRTEAEHVKAYEMRLSRSDYTPFYSHAVDTLAGMFFSVEDKADRRWVDESGNGLGLASVSDTVANRLTRDADGNGTSYTAIWKTLALELNYISSSWIAVEGCGPGKSGTAANVRIKNIPSLSVPNWHIDADTGIMDQVLVTELAVVADSIFIEPTTETQYLLYSLDGWQRYRKNNSGDPVPMTGPNDSGTYEYVDRQGRRILPIYPVRMPMSRSLGEILARKANRIFQQQSELDHILSISTVPKLVVPGSDDEVDVVTEVLIQGSNLLPTDPDGSKSPAYISAPVEGAKILKDVIKEKIAAFYEVFFQVYGEAARTRTATEVMQDVAAGIGAYLQLQKDCVDDAENKALDLIAQAAFTTSKENWFIAGVARSDDMTPVNLRSVIDEMIKQTFGGTTQVPIGPMGRLETIKLLASVRGIDVDVDEVRNEIMISDMMNYQPLMGSFAIPPEAQTELTMAFLANMGLFNRDRLVDGDGDDCVKVLDPDEIRIAVMQAAMEQKTAQSAAGGSGGSTTLSGQSGTQGNHAERTAMGKAGLNAPTATLKSEAQMAIDKGGVL